MCGVPDGMGGRAGVGEGVGEVCEGSRGEDRGAFEMKQRSLFTRKKETKGGERGKGKDGRRRGKGDHGEGRGRKGFDLNEIIAFFLLPFFPFFSFSIRSFFVFC